MKNKIITYIHITILLCISFFSTFAFGAAPKNMVVPNANTNVANGNGMSSAPLRGWWYYTQQGTAPDVSPLPASTLDAPPNIDVGKKFYPAQHVLNWMFYLFNIDPNAIKPNANTLPELKAMIQLLHDTLKDLLTTVVDPEYTEFLKMRDAGRKSELDEGPQIANYTFNAYTEHQKIVDKAYYAWLGIQTALSSMLGYDSLLRCFSNNSEIELRNKLVPIGKIIVRLMELICPTCGTASYTHDISKVINSKTAPMTEITTVDPTTTDTAETGMPNVAAEPAKHDNIPKYYTLYNAFTPVDSVIDWMNYLFTLDQNPSKPSKTAFDDTNQMIKLLHDTLVHLLEVVTDDQYTAYLKMRDFARVKGQTDQDVTTYLFNAYTSYQSMADEAYKVWFGLKYACNIMFGYDRIVRCWFNNSEIKMREALLPFGQIILRLLEFYLAQP